MKARRVGPAEARAYFVSKAAQRGSGLTPDDIDDCLEYWVCDGVCVYFHQFSWPNVWIAHVVADPNAWGRVVAPVLEILRAVWAEKQPDLFMAQVNGRNRLALALVRRIGGFQIAEIETRVGPCVLMGWRNG